MSPPRLARIALASRGHARRALLARAMRVPMALSPVRSAAGARWVARDVGGFKWLHGGHERRRRRREEEEEEVEELLDCDAHLHWSTQWR